jgi:hypothetical protein
MADRARCQPSFWCSWQAINRPALEALQGQFGACTSTRCAVMVNFPLDSVAPDKSKYAKSPDPVQRSPAALRNALWRTLPEPVALPAASQVRLM